MEVLVDQMLSAREEVEEKNEEAPELSKTPPPDFSCQNFPSLDYASTQSFLQDPYNSFHQPQDTPDYSQNSFHIPQHNFTTIPTSPRNPPQSTSLLLQAEQCLQSAIDSRERTRESLERQEHSWKEQETLFEKME
ncbi:hypothetical protein AHAS_Ahas16G0193400 [Arachis hypogaea]